MSGGAPAPDDRRRCTAQRAGGRGPCRAWAIRGGTVCAVHGGRAPQVKAAAGRRLEEELAERRRSRALRALERRLGGSVPVADPAEELLRLLSETRANLEVLGDLVAELAPAPDVEALEAFRRAAVAWRDGERGDPPTPPAALYGPDHLGDARPHVLVTMYLEAIRDHARVAKMAADAGVAERAQALREGEAAAIAALIGGLLSDPRLGLSPAQRHQGRALAAERLRALEAENPDTVEVAA